MASISRLNQAQARAVAAYLTDWPDSMAYTSLIGHLRNGSFYEAGIVIGEEFGQLPGTEIAGLIDNANLHEQEAILLEEEEKRVLIHPYRSMLLLLGEAIESGDPKAVTEFWKLRAKPLALTPV